MTCRQRQVEGAPLLQLVARGVTSQVLQLVCTEIAAAAAARIDRDAPATICGEAKCKQAFAVGARIGRQRQRERIDRSAAIAARALEVVEAWQHRIRILDDDL